ncbi:FecR domain-containing protein [Aquabacterium sp.]|uniref:FecR domain-containing protein n=1 Tax=Aquabacterium sp. TaxID=1872578 RepID=UPI0025C4749E|nr:FecR domain-containing protein [Aquabacterium sp.]
MLHAPRLSALTMSVVAAATLVASLPALAAPPTEAFYIYQAQEGDTLIGLGDKLLGRPQDWPQVGQLNHITHPRRIPVGTRLRIPERLLKRVSREGTVLETVGAASVQPATSPAQPARKGQALPPGSVVRTGGDGYVTVRLADGSVLKIQADTEARLDTSQQYESAGFFSSVWSVVRGRVEALVTHMTGGEPRFQIKTPQAVLGVRGTEFRVDADAARQQTRHETLTGAVGVQGSAGETLVKAGYGSIAQASGRVSPALPLPAAPELRGQPTVHERILVRFDVPPVAGAVAYRAQVAEDADFQRVRGEANSATPVLRFADLPDGHYHLRARSIDAQGLSSADATLAFTLKARPEAPLPSEPAPGSKWRSKTVKLAWAAHPQAQHYRLQVSTGADFAQPLLDLDDLSAPQHELALPPGDYRWRVATVAAGPDRGPWGDAQTFQVRPEPPAPPPPVVDDKSVRYRLQGEPGQRFEFQMARDAAFSDLVTALASDHPDISLPKPQDGGRFLIRYRAIDADGFVGPWTAPQWLTLPACVRSGSGACIGAGERLLVSPP